MKNSSTEQSRILIVGLPKSGTSILTYRVAACRKRTKIFFEPGKQDSLTNINIHHEINNYPDKNIVTKSLYIPKQTQNLVAIEKFYNKKIWIYRDPRDWLISRLLYRWNDLDVLEAEKLISSLKKKEENAREIPLHTLMNKHFVTSSLYIYGKLIDRLKSLSADWLVVRYEDFVDNDIDELNNYLGVEIDTSIEVDRKYDRVARSKSHGNWRRWFNEKDVEYFRPLLSEILSNLKYDADDWAILNPDFLSPEEGSKYVEKLYLAGKKCGA